VACLAVDLNSDNGGGQECWIPEILRYFDGAKNYHDVDHLTEGNAEPGPIREYLTDVGDLVFWGGEGERKERNLGLHGWPDVISTWHNGLKDKNHTKFQLEAHNIMQYHAGSQPPSSAHNIDMRELEEVWDWVMGSRAEAALERGIGNDEDLEAEFTELGPENAEQETEVTDSTGETAASLAGNATIRRFCGAPKMEYRTIMSAGSKRLFEELADRLTAMSRQRENVRSQALSTFVPL
jgi:hypothetical protein